MKNTIKILLSLCIAVALILTTVQPSNTSTTNSTDVQAKGFFKPKPKPKPKPSKPKITSPVSKADGKKALELIGTKGKGTKEARKFLKKKLAKADKSKNYDVTWDVRSKDKKHLKSIVVVIQKKNGKKIGRAFAVDYHKIPLKPGNKKAIWHFHHGSGNTHYTLKKFIPKKHKPDTGTKTL